MRKTLILLAAIGVIGCSCGPAAPLVQAQLDGGPAQPVVVELFQSQGCSSCPPANANLNALAARSDVLALSYAVTYWDYLGWKDTFAKPEFTERQRAYSRRGQSDGVYTPQVVINGSRALVGANRASLDRAIRAAGHLHGPTITADNGTVRIGAGQGAPATVLLVDYDTRETKVPIKAGENTGRTLPHRNIVVSLRDAGVWQGKPLALPLPRQREPWLRTAVLLQQGAGGAIVGAAKL